jgi:hypothetical protein
VTFPRFLPYFFILRPYLGHFKSVWADFFRSISEIKANNFVEHHFL